jgi:peptide-methionine (R)-S-oxide reductase
MIDRRHLALTGAASVGALIAAAFGLCRTAAADQPAETFEITRTPEEWRKLLTPAQYYVLRDHGTEHAFSSPLDKSYNPGTYHCAGCDLPLFSSDTKYDSRTGWPSFWQPLENAVGTRTDYSIFFMPRVEVHCRRCGGHLGHVFDDGPPPTRKRYCMNGIAMKFVPRPPA